MRYKDQRELQAALREAKAIAESDYKKSIAEAAENYKLTTERFLSIEKKLEKEGHAEEIELYKQKCLKADLNLHSQLPKHMRMYKNDSEFEKGWLPHWEDDERLKIFIEELDIKLNTSKDNRLITEEQDQMVKAVSESLQKPNLWKGNKPQKKKAVENIPPPLGEEYRRKKEVQALVELSYTYADIERLTGVPKSTVGTLVRRNGWNRNLPEERIQGIIRPHLKTVKSKHIPESNLRIVWGEWINETRVIEWFKQEGIISREVDMWSIDIAESFARYVGLDDISDDFASVDQITKLSRTSQNYYAKLQKLMKSLTDKGVLFSRLSYYNSYCYTGDKLDEDGNQIIDPNDGSVVQEIKPRASRMNLHYLNLDKEI